MCCRFGNTWISTCLDNDFAIYHSMSPWLTSLAKQAVSMLTMPCLMPMVCKNEKHITCGIHRASSDNHLQFSSISFHMWHLSMVSLLLLLTVE